MALFPLATGCLGLAILAATLPAQAETRGFDRPIKDETITLPMAKPDDIKITIRCQSFAHVMVKARHEGDDIGTAALSVVPVDGRPAPCSAEKQPGERDLAGFDGMELMGAAGPFLVLIWPDGGNSSTRMSVYDGARAVKLHDDVVKDTEDGLRAVALNGGRDRLTLTLTRVVPGSCSLVSKPASCWPVFLKDRAMPADMARRAVPSRLCGDAYAKAKMSGKALDDPSVLAFDVVVEVPLSGAVRLISDGVLECWPAE